MTRNAARWISLPVGQFSPDPTVMSIADVLMHHLTSMSLGLLSTPSERREEYRRIPSTLTHEFFANQLSGGNSDSVSAQLRMTEKPARVDTPLFNPPGGSRHV